MVVSVTNNTPGEAIWTISGTTFNGPDDDITAFAGLKVDGLPPTNYASYTPGGTTIALAYTADCTAGTPWRIDSASQGTAAHIPIQSGTVT